MAAAATGGTEPAGRQQPCRCGWTPPAEPVEEQVKRATSSPFLTPESKEAIEAVVRETYRRMREDGRG